MRSSLAIIVLIAVYACESKSLQTVYRDCGSKSGSIVDVDITGCTKAPCLFQRGQNYTLTLKFKANANTKTLTNHVYGVIAHIPVPFHLPNDDGCQLGLTCPIKSGDLLSESVTLPILTQYPKMGLIVKWVAEDDTKTDMICFEFPVQISD